MTKYIMMALFYAGSVLIAYSLGFFKAEKLYGSIAKLYISQTIEKYVPPTYFPDDEEAVE